MTQEAMDRVCDNPDWLALVQTIRLYPDADLPKLVAADWLEEHGIEDRAHLIRVLCECGDVEREHVSADPSSVAVSHVRPMTSIVLVDRPGIETFRTWSHKGFVTGMRCSLVQLLDDPIAKWLIRREPVTRVDFTEDREPAIMVLESGLYKYGWHAQSTTSTKADAHGHTAWALDLYPFLRNYRYSRSFTYRWQFDTYGDQYGPEAVYYDTEEDAYAALSDAAIRWATQPD